RERPEIIDFPRRSIHFWFSGAKPLLGESWVGIGRRDLHEPRLVSNWHTDFRSTTVIRPQVHHDVCICYRPLGNFRFYGAIPTPGGWGGIIAVDHLNLETAHGPTVVLRRQIDRLFHRCASWDHGSLHRPARDDFDRALRLGHRDA